MIMKTNVSKRRLVFTGILLLFLLLASIFCFAPKAKAAGKTKTMYLPVQIKEVEVQQGSDDSTTLQTKSYYKNGLIKSSSTTYGYGGEEPATSKTNYKHYKNGPLKSYMNYYRGEPYETKTYTLNKKGQIAKEYYYLYSEGKKTLSSTTTYKYKKGKLAGKTEKGTGFKTVTTYYGNGNMKQQKKTEVSKTYDGIVKYTIISKYDKNGNIVSYSNTCDCPGKLNDSSTDESFKNYYNKKGDLIKVIFTGTDTYYEEGTEQSVTVKSVETLKYSYTKFGEIAKCVSTNKSSSGGSVSKYTLTTTYKYKKFKVPKKLVPYAGDQE